MPCNYKDYPDDWPERRARILKRARYRCERCGVAHHAVGYWHGGKFIPNGGNAPCEASGVGRNYDTSERLTYAEAQAYRDHYNCERRELRPGVFAKRATDEYGCRWVVIVLTIAHLDRTGPPGENDGPLDCPDDRLAALCQQCHLKLDAKRHAAKAAGTRKKSEPQLALLEVN